MTFIGRFRQPARFAASTRSVDQERTCTCSHDEELSSGLPAEEVEKKKRQEEEEAAERERQELEAVEAAKREPVSHEPPEHEHQPGEAYGIRSNGGGENSINRFTAASDALRHSPTRQAPTADQLARMTPTQRFAAISAYRHGRRR